MAEKEVCADVVSKTSEESSGRVEGESLLLPLLQGLLDAPDNEQTADSGTESGEDLRNGLLIEVQNVLAKLANSLKSSHDMSEDRRNSLLQLVNRLQTGLGSQQPSASERRASGHGRFLKKRRHNRHTVGVSSEELEDARRLVEEMGLCRANTPLEKRNSESQLPILQTPSQSIPLVKNSIAKPYGSPGSISPSGTSSSVNTPTEVTGVLQLSNPLNSIKLKEPSTSETISSNFFNDSEEKSQISHKPHESEISKDLISAKHKHYENELNLTLQSNPIYTKPNYEDVQDEQKLNRFNNKKLKLKRANTIDIPKPVNIYESEDDYDSDTSLVEKQSSRRNNYLALRGPIRVGRSHVSNTNLPIFEPKTDSDKKFMAFINKHNEKNEQSSSWAQQNADVNKRGNNWNNRFGNIRTAFEKSSVNKSITPTIGMNSARNFWKSADNAVTFRNNESKINKLPQRKSEYIDNKQRKLPWATIEENDVVTGSLKVETKGLDVNKNYKFVPQPLPVNKFSHAPTSAFAAIPRKAIPEVPTTKSDTNNSSQNLIKTDFRNSDSDTNTPLYLYSPKPLPNSSTSSSPSNIPWVSNNCVQKLPTSKFEHKTSNDIADHPLEIPRKLNKEPKPLSDHSQVPVEKVTAPYINKSVDTSNTVRKLSDQFNKIPKQTDFHYSSSSSKPNRTISKLHSYPPSHFHNDYVQYPPSKHENSYYQSSTPTSAYQAYCSSQYNNIKPSQIQYQKETVNPSFSKSYNTPKVSIKHKEEQPEGYTSHTFLKFTPATPKSDADVVFPKAPKQVQYNRQTSQESVKEYEAAVTKVMKGPVAQQAVTVQQNSPKGRDQHDIEVALNLKNVLQKFSEKSPERKLSVDSAVELNRPASEKTQRKTQSFKKLSQTATDQPNFLVNGKPLSMESTEINENGESIVTSKFHIPVTIQSPITKSPSLQMFSKADLWNQLMYDQQQTQRKPAPISSPPKSVHRSKSSHLLAVPSVQFQAGMTKDEVVQKKRTVEAYFSGSVSPQSTPRSPSDDSVDKSEKVEVKLNKSSINRKKTSEKVSTNRQISGGVSRSQTLPNIVCPDLLDESKVEESFEDLFRSNV